VVDDQSNNCTINEHQRTYSDLENEGSGQKLSKKGSNLRRTEYSAAYLKQQATRIKDFRELHELLF
jgi:hypothetical protein